MNLPILLGFTLFSASNTVVPGPNFLLISKTATTANRSVSFATIAGIVTASLLHGLFAIFGISMMYTNNSSIFLLIKLLGASYLCYIGFHALIVAVRRASIINGAAPPNSRQTHTKGFSDGVLTNILNPYTYLFYLSVFPKFITDGSGSFVFVLVMLVIHITLNVIWFTCVVLSIERVAAVFHNSTFSSAVEGISGICLVAAGFYVAAGS